MYLIGLWCLVFLGGCAIFNRAELKVYDFETREGVVSYLNDGISWAVSDRRSKAEVIMRERCGGNYRITKELTQSQYAGTYTTVNPNSYGGVSGMGTAINQEYVYLAFKCQ